MKIHLLIGNSPLLVLFIYSTTISAQNQQQLDSITERYWDSISHVSHVGESFPVFQNKSLDGRLYSNASLRNKITFINFWFEGCHPCMAEMAALNELYSNFKMNSNFQFLSFTFDPLVVINQVKTKFKIVFPILPVSDSVCVILNLKSGFPTSMVIDREGKIAYFSMGGSTDPQKAKEEILKNIYPIIEKLLAENK
jgi:thiol-disulfide isomerase/thioredoxin